ncbi:spermine oxidase-like [Penaeus chinensis]|uniref:spermine oxidase-like n=1 Tax=Penaeus chinensis TaxID=139456 RepID=UPI001FB7B3E0|nr:spermine oxidase-like [Penaeus chinensis]
MPALAIMTQTGLANAVQREVVVVGGGVAGLSAAKTLIAEGVRDIILLEAQDYLGGRVKTYRQDGILTEDGAEWIHGGRANRLYGLARRLGALADRVPDSAYAWRAKTESGRNPDLAGFDVAESLYEICERNNVLPQYSDDGYGKCYADRFPMKYRRYRARRSESDAWLHYLEMWVNKDTGLDDWMHQSARDADRFTDWGFDQWDQWRRGYDALVHHLTKAIPDGKIRMVSPVCKIFWDQGEDARALVVTQDGASYLADHVLVTASVGHLKERQASLFEPALPQKYREALAVTELGLADKVQLGWESPW